MYYGVRYLNNEMLSTCSVVRQAFNETSFGKGGLNAHMTYIMWGSEIKAQFDMENLHLIVREQHPPMEKLVGALDSLSLRLLSMEASMTTMSVRLEGCESMLKVALAANKPPPTPIPASPAVALRTAMAEALDSEAADSAAAAEMSAAVSAAVVANAAAAASSTWLRNATDGVPLQLSFLKGSPDPIVKFTKLKAYEFFVMW
jgi:hypothetical protein